MIVRSIKLRNWLCYRGTHELELGPGLTTVLARYEGQPGRSNWAGKTALLESVLFALWGWHRKRLADDVVTWGEKACSVSLALDGLSVERARASGTPTLAAGGARGEDAQRAIDSAIGLSRDDAFSTVVFRQGDIEALTAAAPAQRQAVLASWLDQGLWERCERRARDEARSVDVHARAARIAADSGKASAEYDLDAAELRLAELKAQTDESRQRLDAVRDSARLLAAKSRFDELKRRAEEWKSIVTRPELPCPSNDEVALSLRSLQSADLEWATAEKLCAQGFDGNCPVVGAKCPAPDHVEDNVARVKRRLPGLREESERLRREHRELESDRELASRRREERQDAQTRLDAAREEGRRLKPDSDAAKDADPRVLRDAQEDHSRLGREWIALKAEIESVKARRRDAEAAAKSSIEFAEKADLLWRVAEVFGRNGVQGAEADSALGEVESRANLVLVGTGLAVKFAIAREGRKLEGACRRCSHAYRGQRDKECPECGTPRELARQDTLDVLVAENGRDYLVDECSGGARAMVAAALRLGSAWLLRSLRGSPVSFLLVDEPFAALDADNRAMLMRRFGEMARLAGFEQVVVVTHDRDLADATPNRVVVTRAASGDSRVEVG